MTDSSKVRGIKRSIETLNDILNRVQWMPGFKTDSATRPIGEVDLGAYRSQLAKLRQEGQEQEMHLSLATTNARLDEISAKVSLLTVSAATLEAHLRLFLTQVQRPDIEGSSSEK